MRLQVIDENGVAVKEPYEVRFSGWTEDRFFAEAPEEGFCEFKDGELIVHAAASDSHQDIVGFLTFLVRGFVSRRSLGRVFNGPGVLRPRQGLCREPDVCFISKQLLSALTAQYAPAADFVIEVVSEGGRKRDLKEKVEEYRAAGIAEYWVVDPANREVVVHRLAGGEYQIRKVSEGRLEAAAIPGFWIEVGWLWQTPLPSDYDCLHEVAGRDRVGRPRAFA